MPLEPGFTYALGSFYPGNQHLNDWGLLAPGDAGCTERVGSRARLSLLPNESLACKTTGRVSRPLKGGVTQPHRTSRRLCGLLMPILTCHDWYSLPEPTRKVASLEHVGSLPYGLHSTGTTSTSTTLVLPVANV